MIERVEEVKRSEEEWSIKEAWENRERAWGEV